MIKLFIHWVLSAAVLMVVAHFVPGFHVLGIQPALVAALVIGLLNGTLGLLLKIVTFPITIITLGLFLLVINALMILIASRIVTGFHVVGWIPALWGAVALALLGMGMHAFTKKSIGIGAAVTCRPLPHHRAYGSVHGGSRGYAIIPRSMKVVRAI
jgi:putative membrane protein